MKEEFISREFYEKIETPNDFETNKFVIMFTKIASEHCKSKNNRKYPKREIIAFLLEKIINHKKQMLNISDNIRKTLELKKNIK